MKEQRIQPGERKSGSHLASRARLWTAVLLLVLFPGVMEAQATGGATEPPAPPSTPGSQKKPASQAAAPKPHPAKLPSTAQRRRALKLYMAASKLYLAGRFDEAFNEYEEAAQLDATNTNYRMAAEIARSHDVMALIETAARDRLGGNAAGARAALERARDLDPKNPEVSEHLYQLGDDAVRGLPQPLYHQAASEIGEAEPLLSAPGIRSFHLRANERQVIQQVFKTYGVEALLDESVRSLTVRYDVDDVDFREAARVLGLATNTFFVPLDAHRVLVANDTQQSRQQFTRQELETISLAGLSSTELTDVGNLARNVFGVQQVAADPTASSLTLRAPPETLAAFNNSMHSLLQGRDQLVLDLRLIQVARSSQVNRGVQPPQSFSAFNVYAEEQSILSANQALVQQIISSGLAAPGDIGAILGILLASGQLSSSLFSGGLALFGGGLTESALAPQPATLNLNLNSSDSREIDSIQLRLGDGEAGTLKEGTKYPIQTSSFSNLSPGLPNIPGLTGAGTSGALGSLLAGLAGGMPSVPMIQYQDLGLTLKVTPKIMRSGDIALTVDLTITALSGAFLDGNPILNNQAFSGVVTLRTGQDAEIASQLTSSESRAITGTPFLSEIPGMNNAADNTIQKNAAMLVIVLTPHLVRASQAAGHTPMLIVEKNSAVR
ncbi:MAG: type II secretion system protein GspD [Acidobacteriota bacterium]